MPDQRLDDRPSGNHKYFVLEFCGGKVGCVNAINKMFWVVFSPLLGMHSLRIQYMTKQSCILLAAHWTDALTLI